MVNAFKRKERTEYASNWQGQKQINPKNDLRDHLHSTTILCSFAATLAYSQIEMGESSQLSCVRYSCFFGSWAGKYGSPRSHGNSIRWLCISLSLCGAWPFVHYKQKGWPTWGLYNTTFYAVNFFWIQGSTTLRKSPVIKVCFSGILNTSIFGRIDVHEPFNSLY